jgi:hypothetical protein
MDIGTILLINSKAINAIFDSVDFLIGVSWSILMVNFVWCVLKRYRVSLN